MRKIARDIKNINIEKFFSKVIAIDNGCWNYIGSKDSNGYGKCYFWENEKSVSYLAHRVSYTIFNGDLNLSMVLDHTCRNRSCVNPDHLREVEFKVNVLENSICPSALNSVKANCPSGHMYDKINNAGARYCSICKNESSKMSKRRKRGAL